MTNMQERLTARFLRYAAINSQSVGGAPVVPSTPGQRQLAELLKSDLAELGLVDLEISEYSVLTGHLPSNLPAGYHKVPTVGWVAHLDNYLLYTSDAADGLLCVDLRCSTSITNKRP